MGGHGSGRKAEPIAVDRGGEFIFPNLSGVRKASNDLFLQKSSGSGLVRTDSSGVLTGGHTTPSGATPGGSNTHVQFNDDGVLGGDAGFTYTKGTGAAAISGSATVDSLTVDKTTTLTGDVTLGTSAQITGGGGQAKPTYAFNADTNTGIYLFSIPGIGFSLGGTTTVDFTSSENVFNEAGGDINFRIESDIAKEAFFLDAETGNIAIGTSTVPTGSGSLMIAHTTSQPGTPGVSGSALFASGSELWAIGGEGGFTKLAGA